MISGVQELRHNFRSKLLKFRSGWQLCNLSDLERPMVALVLCTYLADLGWLVGWGFDFLVWMIGLYRLAHFVDLIKFPFFPLFWGRGGGGGDFVSPQGKFSSRFSDLKVKVDAKYETFLQPFLVLQ